MAKTRLEHDHLHNLQPMKKARCVPEMRSPFSHCNITYRGVSWHYPVACKFYVRGSMYLGSLCRKVRGRSLRIRSDGRLASLP